MNKPATTARRIKHRNEFPCWILALQVFYNGEWKHFTGRGDMFLDRDHAHMEATRHIDWADKQGLDPRNLAIVSFKENVFEIIPW